MTVFTECVWTVGQTGAEKSPFSNKNGYVTCGRGVNGFHRFSVFVWSGENDSNKLRVEAYFFLNTGKKISVFKNMRISNIVFSSTVIAATSISLEIPSTESQNN